MYLRANRKNCQKCSLDDFTVLNCESHKFKCLIKESLLATKGKTLLNEEIQSLKDTIIAYFSITSYVVLDYDFK